MSHHYSGPDFGFPRGDARLDFTDLYAFPKADISPQWMKSAVGRSHTFKISLQICEHEKFVARNSLKSKSTLWFARAATIGGEQEFFTAPPANVARRPKTRPLRFPSSSSMRAIRLAKASFRASHIRQ